MAKVITTELQHSGASAANITLDSSKNVTCENNLTVDGTSTLSGNVAVTGNVTVTGTLPADKLTGNLPAISGASLTGLPSSPPANRNIIINGDMRIAQRSTSEAVTYGLETIDRFHYDKSGTDNTPDQERRTLTSSDTGPWAKGFKYCYKITNGDQSSGGAGATDSIRPIYYVEARDLHHSGWLYNDASSKITISFWVKSSVAQRFYLILRTDDGTGQNYGHPYTISSANTWQKVTHTIPGHANLTFNDDSGVGMLVQLPLFLGHLKTNDSFTDDAWAAYDSASNCKDYDDADDDWYLTNDATWEITGLQLEVADTATEFEFRPYADELRRCQRYYWKNKVTDAYTVYTVAANYSTQNYYGHVDFPVEMRASGSGIATGTSAMSTFEYLAGGSSKTPTSIAGGARYGPYGGELFIQETGDANLTPGQAGWLRASSGGANGYISFDAEY